MASQQFFKGYPFTLLAVADGHGSEKYSRSEIGAHWALEATRDAAFDFIQAWVQHMELEQGREWPDAVHEFRERFGKSLVKQWRDHVQTDAQRQDATSKAGPSDSQDTIQRYGSTVAMVLIFEDWLFIGAIGDSPVYLVRRDPTEPNTLHIKPFFPPRQDTLGQGTASLCTNNAARNWESTAVRLEDVAMVLLTTDGMPDSLENPEQSVLDIYRKTQAHGIDWLREILPEQLERWSREGVGDDMAMVVCFPDFRQQTPAQEGSE